jgi:hypothetical protein
MSGNGRFGTAEWRAEGWEEMQRAAQSGDQFRGEQQDGSWVVVMARVSELIAGDGRRVRFVYVARQDQKKDYRGRFPEMTFEAFATMHFRIEPMPRSRPQTRGGVR